MVTAAPAAPAHLRYPKRERTDVRTHGRGHKDTATRPERTTSLCRIELWCFCHIHELRAIVPALQ